MSTSASLYQLLIYVRSTKQQTAIKGLSKSVCYGVAREV